MSPPARRRLPGFRTAAGALGGGLVALGGGLLATPPHVGGFGPLLLGVLVLASLAIERRYHGPRLAEPGDLADFAPTSESFRDEESGKTLWVWYNAKTGERRYVPIERPLN